MQIHRSNHQRGSSLIEVLVSLLILCIVSVAAFASFEYSIKATTLLRENQRATQILLEKTETLRLYNWTQVNTPGFIPSAFTNAFDPQRPTEGVKYYGTVTIGPCPDNTGLGTNIVAVTIGLDWTDQQIKHHREVTTYIAKDGMQNYIY